MTLQSYTKKTQTKPSLFLEGIQAEINRLPGFGPVAVVDIGSNSIRIVIYERLSRSPTVIYNEKSICRLGEGLSKTGLISDKAIEYAISTLKRFKSLAELSHVVHAWVIATAAVREAKNGLQFSAQIQEIWGEDIHILNGDQEARYAALGTLSGFMKPKGLCADLGGGSLELAHIDEDVSSSLMPENAISLPIGVVKLPEQAEDNLDQAQSLMKTQLDNVAHLLQKGKGQPFYAIGGTWRALAIYYMEENAYPLHILHQFELQPEHITAFCDKIIATYKGGDICDYPEKLSKQRHSQIPYGALILRELVKMIEPSKIYISASGIREGLLFEQLNPEDRQKDPLIEAAKDLDILRSRSHEHTLELIGWSDQLFEAVEINESDQEKRLRHAATHLADISWRSHPDYRGEQSFNLIAHGAFVGIDHPGRAYLACAVATRYHGLKPHPVSEHVRQICGEHLYQRARLLGGVFRVAYSLSAAMSKVLPYIALTKDNGTLVMHLPEELEDLNGRRLQSRLGFLADRLGLKSEVRITTNK